MKKYLLLSEEDIQNLIESDVTNRPDKNIYRAGLALAYSTLLNRCKFEHSNSDINSLLENEAVSFVKWMNIVNIEGTSLEALYKQFKNGK